MQQHLVAGIAVCASLLSPLVAHADGFYATRSDRLVERAHDVAVTLYQDHARLIVQRTVFNGGSRHDQATFHIDLPRGAVATGLRTFAKLQGRPHWYDGDLMEAEAAAAKYQELTGLGGHYPKDPALLSWLGAGRLTLQVFPCPPGEDKRVEYTVQMPTEYVDGAYRITLPHLGTGEVNTRIVVHPNDPLDQVLVDGRPLAKTGVVTIPPAASAEVALLPHSQVRLGGALAVVPFAPARVFTRFRFEAGRTISSVPEGAYVVVVIDASRSVGDYTRRAAAATVSSALSHFPGAKVEVLTFDRRVHPRYGQFVDVAQARADFEQLAIPGANGSALDDALLIADRLLQSAPAGAARRVLAVTDGLARSQLTPERMRGAVGTSSAVFQLGIFTKGEPELQRLDEHAWAPAIRSTGGLVWEASGTNDANMASDQVRIYEEWARPLRIDRLRLFSPDLALDTENGESFGYSLAEGQSASYSRIVDRKVSWVRLEGELWATSVHEVLVPDTERNRRWAALIFGTDHLGELTEPEMMTLAMKGGAVSPVTSYLAIEPGVRPSTEGFDRDRLGGWHRTRAPRVRSGVSYASGHTPYLDRDAWLGEQLGRAWRACGGAPQSASVDFETTREEVVHVGSVHLPADDPLLGQCLTEAVWSLVLPIQFTEDWNVWSVTV